MHKVLASGKHLVSNAAITNRRGDAKTLFQSASGILNSAISRILPQDFGLPKRTYVTEQTYEKLQEAIPKRIDIGKTNPYQEESRCYFQALEIMAWQAAEVRRGEATSSSAQPSLLERFWDKAEKIMGGNVALEKFPSNAEALLAKFNEKGSFALCAPGLGGLGDGYVDHTVLAFSVSKINVPSKGPRIVVGVIDCNDEATDPETMASKETAPKMGKSHISELTHEEANEHGAHLRRIRFMDADALIQHVRDETRHSMNLIQDGVIEPPRIVLPRKSIPTLTAEEAEKLSKILVEIYDTPEVEKFEDQSFNRTEDAAAAQRSAGGAMARSLYKAASQNKG